MRLSWLLLCFPLLVACKRPLPRHISIWRLTSSDRQIWKLFEQSPQQPVIFYFKSGQHVLRAWSIGHDSLPVTLLLHGAPSSMVRYQPFFSDSSLYRRTRLVAVDRPGYGRSEYGKATTSVAQQAAILAPLLKQLAANGPVTLYGSSYGGSVAAKLAMDHAQYLHALILQSASVEPGAERIPTIARWIRSPLGVFFPKWARVSTKEKFAHYGALQDIQDGWSRITCPVWIVHGKDDDLIYPSNAAFAEERLLPHTEVHVTTLDSVGHNMFWDKRPIVTQALLEALAGNGHGAKGGKDRRMK
jgi:pimeloyl-ACP methyl ester carboxylesterase